MTSAGDKGAEGSDPGLSRRRTTAVWALIAAASVLALASCLTLWVDRQVLDNDAWSQASSELIENDEVRGALATHLVNQLYANVDVQQAVEKRLPPNLKQFAAPIAQGLRQPATSAAEALLARPRVKALWVRSSTIAHQRLLNLLEDKTAFGTSTAGGVVSIDLRELLVELGGELGLPPAALARIPEGSGSVVLLRSNQLAAAQTSVKVIKFLSVWLVVLVLALYAIAIYIAHGVRRAALRNVGWSLIAVGLVVLIIRNATWTYGLETLASPAYTSSVHRVFLVGTEILGEIGVAAVLYGAIAMVGAVLAGPTRAAIATRRALAPALAKPPGTVALGAGLLYLLIVFWGPTHALRMWWGILLFAALLALGIVALRRQTLAEFPEREPALLGPWRRVVPASQGSLADELARLAQLRDEGVLSKEEFARAKSQALS